MAVDEKKQWFRKPPKETDATIAVKPPCRIIDKATGKTIAIALAGQPTKSLLNKITKLKMPGNPMGGGKRLAGYSQGSAMVFGYSPKRPIQTGCQVCRSCAIHRDNPEAGAALTDLSTTAWELLGKHAPEKRDHLLEQSSEIKECWKMNKTGFTSGIINKNTPLRYHYDAGNYDDSWSAMLWASYGTSGGALALPAYNVKIELENGAWLFFCGQSVLHGVTPITLLSKKSYRYSIVFYCNKEMRNCGSMEEELVNAKKRRTESESREKRAR